MATDSGTHVVTILAARDDVSIVRASCAARERVTTPHLHHEHTDSFYVLEGELTFDVAGETIVVSAGGFIAVPRNVPHSFRNAAGVRARWLTIHTPDAGFARFIRERGDVEWDVAAA